MDDTATRPPAAGLGWSHSCQETDAIRALHLILGDQLNGDAALFDDFDPVCDSLWMSEVRHESTKVWSHKVRVVLFLSAMRHFALDCREKGSPLLYHELSGEPRQASFESSLTPTLVDLTAKGQRPERLVVVQPGEWDVLQCLKAVAQDHDLPLEIREDRHFLCPAAVFENHAKGRKQLRMEFFYREMRQGLKVLLTTDGKPEGESWNFDHDNRGSFGKQGPPAIPQPVRFEPDAITRDVMATVEAHFPNHPGDLSTFDWPVTTAQAQVALEDFIEHRLASFGVYQDALWTGEPTLFHSRLSAAMNLKLLDPRLVIRATEAAYRDGRAPLPAVEGFIRQILGWREYVRGIYWLKMPEYRERNALEAHEPLPAFYWTGDTRMACLRDSLGMTLKYGYAHHIQRLMVTGLYALLLGVEPKAVHEWYLAVYVDAIEWVELPNTLGMSQYGDGGVMGSKPYVATGKYIQRMSNYCGGCRYNPAESVGPTACPFTTLYWDFLLRHEVLLATNPRMSLQVRNLKRLNPADRQAINDQAAGLRASGGTPAGGLF